MLRWLVIAVLLVLAVLAGVVVARGAVVALWPPAARLYALAGFAAEPPWTGLKIEKLAQGDRRREADLRGALKNTDPIAPSNKDPSAKPAPGASASSASAANAAMPEATRAAKRRERRSPENEPQVGVGRAVSAYVELRRFMGFAVHSQYQTLVAGRLPRVPAQSRVRY